MAIFFSWSRQRKIVSKMTWNRHSNVGNCLKVVDNAPNGVEGCLDFQNFDREAHTEINDSTHCTGTNRISNRIDIPQLPLSVRLRMCFDLETKLFAMNQGLSFPALHLSHADVRAVYKIAFHNFSAYPASLNINIYTTLTQFFVLRFAVTKLIVQYASPVVHKSQEMYSRIPTWNEHLLSITCNITVHEMRSVQSRKCFSFPYPLSVW